jgi:enhancing lycopene biosynthesis protein 2
MKYIKKQILHERKIKDRQLIINADGSIELNPLSGNVTVNGNLRVTGSSSGPTNSLTYYVSLQGSDNNDGLAAGPDRAKRTVKAAVEAAPPGATIQIAPGDYFENNPITLKERQTVRGTSLRNTQIYPLNNTLDMFLVDNACYIFQITFRGLRDPGWCVRIKPGTLCTVSPYVQNCTNMNGPWLNDGTEFIPFETVQIQGIQPGALPIINNENVPFAKRVNETGGGNGMLVDGNEYDPRSLVFSMVADSFTQIAQGGIGFHITNFGYTQIVSCFSVFTRIGFLATKGGYLSISNSVSDFGTFAIIADGVFDVPYTTARPAEDYFSTIGSVSITNPGFGYTSAPVVEIDPPGDSSGVQALATASIDSSTGQITSVRIDNPGSGYDFIPQVQFIGGGFSQPASAIANLITNRIVEVNSLRDKVQVGSIITFNGDNTKYYITNSEILREPFVYDETICRRDVRRIVDAVVGDMVMGTNYQALAAGRSYLRSTAGLVLQQQLTPTIFGIEAARDEMLDRITGNDAVDNEARNRITESFAIITNILEQGDSTAAPDIIYNDLATIDQGVIDAKDNIVANRDFIIEEITKYIAQQFTNLSYNQPQLEQDVRDIMTGVAFDVALGTNYNSVFEGKKYEVNDRFKPLTVDAFEFVRNNIAQFSSVAGDATALQRSNAGFNEVIDIINDETPSNLTFPDPVGASQNRINSKNQLILNRTFIQAEIIAWINNEISTALPNAAFDNFQYSEEKYEDEIGLIVDALTYDIIYGGNTANKKVAALLIESSLSANETLVKIESYRRLQGIVSQLVQGGQVISSPGNNETQDTSAGNAGPIEADTLSSLIEIIIGVTQAGNTDNIVEDDFPSINWTTPALQNATNSILAQRDNQAIAVTNYILQEYPEFTYDRVKYRQDVGLIIDAVARDVRLNTNHNSIVAGLVYRRQSTNVQLPTTILSLREAQRLCELAVASSNVTRTRVTARFEELLHIIEFGELPQGVVQFFNVPPIAGVSLINASQQLQDNRTFLIEETIAWVNNEINIASGNVWDGLVYDQALFARSVEFIVNAVIHDLLYGGNRSILIATRTYYDTGISQFLGNQEEPTALAIEHLRDVASQVIRGETVIKAPGNTEPQINTSGPGTVTESNLSESLFDISINGIRGGLITTPPQVNPTFTWVTIDIQEAVANLLLEDFNIRDGVIDFITNNIIGFAYNVEKCGRDTGYIVDAAVYDMMYDGNKQTRRAGEAYYNNVVIRGQEAVTEFSYKRLAEVLDLIAQDIAVTPSEDVIQTQTISGTPGSSAAGETISDRVLTIADVVRFGISVLPAEVDHDYDNLGDVDLNVRRNVILDDLQAIEDESIRLLNLEFGGEARISIFPGLISVLEGTLATLVNVSTVSTAGHAFEYVGAGITYNALPFFGGSPIPENEVVESNDGKVFAGGTVDQIGNFRVGNFFNVNALDGSITLNAEQINLQGLSSIGPFRRDGIPVGVELREVSDSTDLVASIGVPDTNTAPTQNAVVQYVENRYFNKNTGSTVLGPSIFQDDVQINGDLETTQSTFNLINDNVNTINFGGGASVITIGDEIGTTTIRNSVVVDGDLNISGGNSSSIAGNLSVTVNENAAEAFTIKKDAADSSVIDYITIGTINTSESVVFGEEPQIAILNQTESVSKNTGALTVDGGVGIAKNLNVGGNILMEGDTFSTVNNALFLFNNSAGVINAFGDATEIEIGSSGIVPGNFIVNNDKIIFTSEYTLQLPTGGTGTRGAPNIPGQIRFNTDLIQFEGYDGLAWGSLGGVKDIDGDTLILAELTPGSNDDTLFFITAGLQRMTLSTSALDIANTITSVTINGTTASTNTTSGQLVVAGGVGIGGNLNIGGSIGLTGNSTITGNLTVDGNTVLGNDRSVDNVTLSGTTLINIPDNVAVAFDVVEGTNSYIRATTTDSAEFVTFGTIPQIRINNTTESTSNTTGALVVAGGVAVAKNLNVDGDFDVNGNATIGTDVDNNTVTVIGDYLHTIPDNRAVAYEIKEGTNAYFILETSNNNEKAVFGTTPIVEIQNTTESTSHTNGALVVTGGVGVAKNLNVNGDFDVNGSATIGTDVSVDTVTVIGDYFHTIPDNRAVAYEIKEGTNVYFSLETLDSSEKAVFGTTPIVEIQNTTESTSHTDGSLIIAGGVGVAKNLNVDGNFDVNGNATIGTDASVDTITLVGDYFHTIPDNRAVAYEIKESTNVYFSLETLDSSEFVRFGTLPQVRIDNNTNSTSHTTGALVVTGGAGIGGNLNVNGDFDVNGSATIGTDVDNNTVTVIGDYFHTIPDNRAVAYEIKEGTNVYFSLETLNSSEKAVFGTTPIVEIQNTTDSTSHTNGALIVAGGVGVAKNLNVNGDFDVNGSATIGTDVSVDTITLVGDYLHTIPDNRAVAYEIKEGTNVYFSLETLNDNEKVTFGTTPIVEIQNTTESTSHTNGALIVAGGVGVAKNLNVDGDFDVNGSATIGTDVSVDTVTVIGDYFHTIPDNRAVAYEIKEGTNVYFSLETLNSSEFVKFGTTPIVEIQNTTESTSHTNGALIVAGGVGVAKNLNVSGNLTVDGNTVFGNDRSVDNVTLSGTTLINIPDNVAVAFDVVEGTNSYIRATTTDSAEFVTFGTIPQIRINNTTESTSNTTGALVVAGGVAVAKNLNVDGNLIVKESVTLGDDVSVDTITLVGDYFHTIPDNKAVAYEIKEGTSVYFKLETSNDDEKVIFGTTPIVEIQNTTDSTDETNGALVVSGGVGIALNLNVGVDFTVGRDAIIEGDLEVRGGDLTTDQTAFNLLNSTATTVNAFGAATAINIGAATGTLTVNNEITVFDSVKAIKLPVGDDADRPTPATGYIRFNTDLVQFEGYDGIAWNTLGGVRDVDGDTFIIAETAPGEDEDTLFFHTGGTLRMTLDTTDLDITSSINVAVKSTTSSTSSSTGALIVSGGVGIAENLYVGGRIGGNLVINELSSETLTINGDTVLIPNTVTLRTASDNTTQSSVLYPATFEHRTSGTPAAGVGTGIQFRTQTGSATFKTGGAIDVVALDVTGNQEDFDMVFRTMVGGASASEKLRLSETMATFNADVRLLGDTVSSSLTTFNLINDTVTTLNFAGAATAISIGAATGTTTVNHNLTVDQTVTADELVLTNDLEVQYGGTGVSTFTVNGIVYGDAADPVKVTDAAGTSDINTSFQILTVTSEVDATPVWTDTIDGGEY